MSRARLPPCLGLLPLLLPAGLALDGLELEVDYILQCQSDGRGAPIGAINDMYPANEFSWIVPSEMAVTGWALVQLGFEEQARNAGNYLAIVQKPDGSWADQYHGRTASSPTSSTKNTVQPVMFLAALHARGLGLYAEILQKARDWLVGRYDPRGLIDGGVNQAFWLSDNAYAVIAWHRLGEMAMRDQTVAAINQYFRAGDYWHPFIKHDFTPGHMPFGWIHFAPAMLDLFAFGILYPDGLAQRMQNELFVLNGPDYGAVLDSRGSQKRMPGIGFQASLAWRDLDSMHLVKAHTEWCEKKSGLWQKSPDENNVRGGWVDWKEASGKTAPTFQRFIDTSSYYLMVTYGLRFHGGPLEPTIDSAPHYVARDVKPGQPWSPQNWNGVVSNPLLNRHPMKNIDMRMRGRSKDQGNVFFNWAPAVAAGFAAVLVLVGHSLLCGSRGCYGATGPGCCGAGKCYGRDRGAMSALAEL